MTSPGENHGRGTSKALATLCKQAHALVIFVDCVDRNVGCQIMLEEENEEG